MKTADLFICCSVRIVIFSATDLHLQLVKHEHQAFYVVEKESSRAADKATKQRG